MRIGVIHHGNDFSNDYAVYVAALLDTEAKRNDYVIREYPSLFHEGQSSGDDNVIIHFIIPISGRFSIRYWYRMKLPALLKKQKVDKIICMYGILTASSINQLLLVPDMSLLQLQKQMPQWRQHASRHLSNYLKQAASVITYSDSAKKELEKLLTGDLQKIDVLPYTADNIFKQTEWHDKLYIKSRFAENKEYFVAVLPQDDEKRFTQLLKAFSKFKKWQQSSMQLLLLPKEENFSRIIEDKLDAYKYRNDVKLINDADKKDTADILSTAYALLHVPSYDSDLWSVSAALQCCVPVISFNENSVREYCGDAAIIVTEPGYEAFGEALIQLYKDEAKRAKMAEQAGIISKRYQQNEHAAAFWQLLNKTA